MFKKIINLIPLGKSSLTIIGMFVILLAIPLTVFLAGQQQEIRQRADSSRDYRDYKPSELGINDPNVCDRLHTWKAIDVNRECSQNSDCPPNTDQSVFINPDTSNWCYGFAIGARCLQLRYIGTGVEPSCNPGGGGGGGGGTGGAPSCNDGSVSLTTSPQPVNAGDNINFRISGNASTWVGDDFQNAVENCSGDWRVNGPGLTCRAKSQGSFNWAHTWKNCVGDINNCSSQCSKSTQFTISGAPGNTNLEVNVKMQQATSPRNPTRQVEVKILSTQNQEIKSEMTNATFQMATGGGTFRGTLNLGSFTSGTYVVKLKIGNTLRRRVENLTNITAGQVNTLREVELFSGDIIADNELNALDYSNLIGCLDRNRGTPRYGCQNSGLADFNDDGSVDLADLNILVFNFSHRRGD